MKRSVGGFVRDCGGKRFSQKSEQKAGRWHREAGTITQPLCGAFVLLDKQGRKKLLRLVDAHTMVQEELAQDSFIAGFRLAWGIATELSMNGSYSYEQEQLTCFRERGERHG